MSVKFAARVKRGLQSHEMLSLLKIVVSTRSTGTENRIFKGGAMKNYLQRAHT